jgi:hypothetical protein
MLCLKNSHFHCWKERFVGLFGLLLLGRLVVFGLLLLAGLFGLLLLGRLVVFGLLLLAHSLSRDEPKATR